jgi:iron(III) transport system substrate-binding protein
MAHIKRPRALLCARPSTALLAVCLLTIALLAAACGPTQVPAGSDDAGATSAAPVTADPFADPEADPEAGEAEAEPDPEAGQAEGGADADAEPAADLGSGGKLVLYSGRSQNLVEPLIEDFERETGIDVETRWGGTAELAVALLEEGDASPADVFFAQDPGGLGAVEALLALLPQAVLDRVPARYADPDGRWVGISGRARTVVYNTERVQEADLPADLEGFTDPAWKGRIGWAPANASFQAMVTAMRKTWGEEKTRTWLKDMLAGEPTTYEGNAPIVAAVGAGEVDVGLVNHYYLSRFLEEEGADFPARNYFMPGGGPGSLVLVSGAGILASAERRAAAEQFVAFLLSPEAQQYFSDETAEYPLVEDPGVEAPANLVPIESLNAMQIDLADLADLEGTVALLRDVGALP